MGIKIFFQVLVVAFLLFNRYVYPAEIKTSGFSTAAVSISNNDAKYDYEINERPDFIHLSRMGLNFSSKLSKKWFFSIQMLAKSWPSESKDFNLKLDWAFGTYKLLDNLHFKVGKQKFPIWLISSHYDVGFLYPWVRPPPEVYSINSFRTLHGFSSEYYHNVAGFRLKTELLYGQAPGKAKVADTSVYEGTAKGMYGVTLAISDDNYTFRGAYAKTTHADLVMTTSSGTSPSLSEYEFISAGTKIDVMNFFFYGEYAQGKIKDLQDLTGAYGTIGYNYKIFSPHLTLATYEVHVLHERTLSTIYSAPTTIRIYTPSYKSRQHSITAGLLVRTSDATDFKIDFQRVIVPKISGAKVITTSSVGGSVVGTSYGDDLEVGLFSDRPDKDVSILRVAFDFVF